MGWILIAAAGVAADLFFSRRSGGRMEHETAEGRRAVPPAAVAHGSFSGVAHIHAASGLSARRRRLGHAGLPVSTPRPAQGRLRLTVDGADGERVHEVDLLESDLAGKAGYLIGHCRSDRRVRAFSLGVIKCAIDLDGKRVVGDAAAFAAEGIADPKRRRSKRACTGPTRQGFKLICASLARLAATEKLALMGAIDTLSAIGRAQARGQQEAFEFLRGTLWTSRQVFAHAA